MTYQVLARKWRPRSFDTLIGQDHVVRALSHALDTQRLHHAWLFTGTRGVGKTTLSRILAKALNCEKGVSSTPCGQCRACVEIDQGRFVDYVELDAASNRGVDEMTQLLEQAVYAPSSARYKVYMIDEVHMLTGHAFNAMLKTLEEPPAHVKFILATTDPQKIPVTVLSRCLQFNLKQMTVPAIEQHLQEILQQEKIPAETPALRLLAQAAAGSMRDALSLTDQAIAYSAGSVSTDDVQGMLGTIDQSHLVHLLQALIDGNGATLIAIADDMALRALSFSGALADLATLLSRIAIQQRVPGALPPDELHADSIIHLAQQLSPDHVQLFYSVVVHSRDELVLAPDEYAGFIMACMRLFALTPAGSLPTVITPVAELKPAVGVDPIHDQPSAAVKPIATEPKRIVGVDPVRDHTSKTTTASISTDRTGIQPPMVQHGGTGIATAPITESVSDDLPPWETAVHPAPLTQTAIPSDNQSPHRDLNATPISVGVDSVCNISVDTSPPHEETPVDDSAYDDISHQSSDYDTDFSTGEIENGSDTPPVTEAVQQAVAALNLPTQTAQSPEEITAAQWAELAVKLPLSGWASELAQQAEWVSCDGTTVLLRVDIKSADDSQAKPRINTVLNEYFGQALRLQIEYGSTGDETAYAIAQAEREKRQKQAEADAPQNPFILSLIQQFDAQIMFDSIRAK